MSSYGEDIIRETFEKLGDAIGVQMQIPDAMITNLRVSLQAQIDLLAELQPTGRLIPAGGHVLTAEQVEDVEALVATANPYSAPAARLRALFPATEPAEVSGNLSEIPNSSPAPAVPAEEVKPVKFRKMTPKYATANFGFPDVTVDPFTPFTRWAYKDSDGDKWAWNGDQWELHIVPPSPAEPAEEETKAEVDGDFIEIVFDGPPEAVSGRFVEVENPQGASISVGEWIDRGDGFWALRIPYPSSPVVPAPTETGPWETWDAVPEGVTVKAANGERFRKTGVGAIHLLTNGVGDCCQVDTEANPLPAPFTAVEGQS